MRHTHEDEDTLPTPDQLMASELALLRKDVEDIDAILGLAGPGRTRFYGDRLVRLRALLGELDNYRNAARAARGVR